MQRIVGQPGVRGLMHISTLSLSPLSGNVPVGVSLVLLSFCLFVRGLLGTPCVGPISLRKACACQVETQVVIISPSSVRWRSICCGNFDLAWRVFFFFDWRPAEHRGSS